MHRPTSTRRESINRRPRRATASVLLTPLGKALWRLRKERPRLPKIEPFLPRLLIKLLSILFIPNPTLPLSPYQQTAPRISYECPCKRLHSFPLRSIIKRPVPPMHPPTPPLSTKIPLTTAH